MAAQTALATLSTPYVALLPDNDALDILRDNLGGEKLTIKDLPRVTIPAGGATFFAVGDEAHKELIGTVIDSHIHRAYWSTALDSEGKTPPDCSSPDGETGYAKREEEDDIPLMWEASGGEHDCETCPFAQWRSGKGNAIACKKMREVVFLAQGERYPYIINLSPTSTEAFSSFAKGLALKGISLLGVEIKLKPIKKMSGGGIEYSILDVQQVRRLDEPERLALRQYGAAFRHASA